MVEGKALSSRRPGWFEVLPGEVRLLCERIEPLAEKAEAGPLSFADVNRLHALVLDFSVALAWGLRGTSEVPETPVEAALDLLARVLLESGGEIGEAIERRRGQLGLVRSFGPGGEERL